MTDMEILQLADQCGVVAVTKHEWDGKQFNHTDDYLDGDGAALIIFAKLVAQHEREACAKLCDLALFQCQETMNELDATEHIAQCIVQGAMNQAVKLSNAIRARGQA